MTKTIEASRIDWEHKLTTLWAYRIAYKVATNYMPFSLAFGLEAIMPMEYFVPSLRVAVHVRLMEEALIERLLDLKQLNEG